jgi:glycosyltransferase involved in cell wall biosynthesis
VTGEPLVSVVIPTFERVELLRQAVASALAQTHASLEILVCDDGDSDEVARMLAGFADERISHRRNRPRLGMGANKVSGYRAARGRYFANLDDDDVMEPAFVATLVAKLEADADLVIAFSDHWIMRADGTVDEHATERNTLLYRGGLARGRHQPFLELALKRRAVPMAQATLIRRDGIDLDDFPEEADVTSDLWLTYLASRTGLAAWYEPARLTRYRVHGHSATRSGGSRWHRSYAACYERFLDDPNVESLWPHFRMKLGLTATSAGASLMREGRPDEALSWSRKALRAQPGLKPLVLWAWSRGALLRNRRA